MAPSAGQGASSLRGALQPGLRHQLDPQPVRVAQAEHPVAEAGRRAVDIAALRGKAGDPCVEGGPGNGEGCRVSHAGAEPAWPRILEGEEGEETARTAAGIAVVEVVGVRRVEVDGALDQPQARTLV
jgi:hypothetical protein